MRDAVRLLFAVTAFCLTASVTAAQEAQSTNAKPPLSCVAVLGAVKTPMRLAVQRRIRLTEVLKFAGGITDRAGPTIQIISSGAKCTEEAPNTSGPHAMPRVHSYRLDDVYTNDEVRNPYLEGGDVVVVTEGDCAYIVGAVVQPQQIFLQKPVSLTQAIARAGGFIKDARTDKVSIYRQSTNSGPRLQLVLDLDNIRKKRAEDPMLQPNDIVEVPNRYGQPSRRFWDPQPPIYDAPTVRPPVHRVIYGFRSGI